MDGAYISILCRILQKDGTANGTYQLYPSAQSNNGKYAYTAVPIDPTWLPGRCYTYQITFFGTDGGGGLIDPTPHSPAGGPTVPGITNATIEDDPGTDATPVVGGPLSLTVSVSDWGTGTGQTVDLN